MITPTALGTSSTLSSALAQTTTSGSGGGISWQLILLAALVGIVVLAIAWLMFGNQGSSSD